MGRKVRVITLKWTNLGVSNNNPDNYPTTLAPQIIYMGGSETATVTVDTRLVVTGAPTFDLHTYGTNDISAWPAVTSQFQTNIVTAQAKNVVTTVAFTRGPRALKFLLDVNTAALAAAEYVLVTVYITEAS